MSQAPDVMRDSSESGERIAGLLKTVESVKDALRRTQGQATELRQRLLDAVQSSNSYRENCRAALNMVEDAIQARHHTLVLNTELQRRIEESQRAEAALRESELRFQARSEELQRLHGQLEQRVQDRTRELQNRTQQLEEREERLRELAAQLTRVEQKERQRLGRVLHDHIQQLLVAAKMQLGALGFKLDQSDQSESARLSLVLSILDEAINASRDLSVQLTPPYLHDLGLSAALDWLVSRTKKMHDLSISTTFDPQANPPTEEQRDVLFQAAQELLLNVIKHAKVKTAELILIREDHEIRLEVLDEGVGFDVSKAETTRASFGLFQLNHRLESIGGAMTINSSPDQGTCVSVVIHCDSR